jgi:biofilm PGA synthesis N-glycosyltransferase PgaC
MKPLTISNHFTETTYLQRPVMTIDRWTSLQRRGSQEALAMREPVITHHNTLPGYSSTKPMSRRPMLALLIAAHNEELVLGNTIKSALKAGMLPEHVYVVDDNSSDKTSAIARQLLGADNVIKVGRSGKGLALTKANKHFQLTRRYRWIHIADADGAFSPDYFKVFRKRLRVKYAAATGYVRSLPGGPISQYRVMEYTIGQEIHRRFQAMTHTVTVIPGPTSCFRADIFRQVDFANKSLCEDFDVTLQIHRKGLG